MCIRRCRRDGRRKSWRDSWQDDGWNKSWCARDEGRWRTNDARHHEQGANEDKSTQAEKNNGDCVVSTAVISSHSEKAFPSVPNQATKGAFQVYKNFSIFARLISSRIQRSKVLSVKR